MQFFNLLRALPVYLDDLNKKFVGVILGGTTTSSGEAAGLAVVDGLARSVHRISAGETYSATTTLGFRIIIKGTGTLTIISLDNPSVPVVITASELTEMGGAIYGDWPIACTALVAGTGMEILAYIP